jgi:23S rRNA G2445 N2-methylase RlmL
VAAARANAARANLPIEIAQADLEEVRAPVASEGRGLVLTNPPYGKRVGDPRALRPLYARLGRLLRAQFRGWRAGVLVADLRLLEAIGLAPVEKQRFVNGGLRVTLAVGRVK